MGKIIGFCKGASPPRRPHWPGPGLPGISSRRAQGLLKCSVRGPAAKPDGLQRFGRAARTHISSAWLQPVGESSEEFFIGSLKKLLELLDWAVRICSTFRQCCASRHERAPSLRI